MKYKLITLVLAVAVIASLVIVGCAKPAEGPAPGPIEIRGLTVFDPGRPHMLPAKMYTDKVNGRAKGELVLKIIGGPEVIKMFDQPEALRDGSIDYLLTFAASYKSIAPETIPMAASEYMPWEEREEGGYYDFLDEVHKKKMNAHYLGRAEVRGFYFYSNKRIESVEDFKGLKVGVTGLWEPLTKALGATPVIVEEPDIYTAMDRGVINSYIGPTALPQDFGIYEITKYAVGPQFYRASNMVHLVNLDAWNKIPERLQNIMDESAAELDRELVKWCGDVDAKNLEEMAKGGMEYIELPPDEAEKYISIANSMLWDEVKPLVSADTYDELKQLLEK